MAWAGTFPIQKIRDTAREPGENRARDAKLNKQNLETCPAPAVSKHVLAPGGCEPSGGPVVNQFTLGSLSQNMSRMVFLRAAMVCAAAYAATQGAFAQTKIGIINVQRAVLETADIKKAQRDLEAKFKARADLLDKMQRELNDLQVQLQNTEKLSPQGQLDLQGRAAKKQREARNFQEDLQADVDRERNDILQRAGQRMTEVVKKLAEEKGLDAVIDGQTTLYFKPALDITDEAIKAYDKTYPVK